jgi:hypothetical protein
MPIKTEQYSDDMGMRMEESFRNAEANCRLSGKDPSGHPLYESIKARIIAGTLSIEEARKEIVEHFTAKEKKQNE